MEEKIGGHPHFVTSVSHYCWGRQKHRDKNYLKKTLCPIPCSHKLADQKTRKTLERGDFRLLHYAGEVTYCVVGEALRQCRVFKLLKN